MKHLNASLVHYVIADSHEKLHGQCRPALVVQDWAYLPAEPDGVLNLIVFRDGENDRRLIEADGQTLVDDALVQWLGSIPHSTTHQFNSWHRPSECHHKED